jgi:hypothetical protein
MNSSVLIGRIRLRREPERGWLETTGSVNEFSDGHGVAPIVFLGLDQSQGRGKKIVFGQLPQCLDPDA